jgi:single-strand DNA-binding protein
MLKIELRNSSIHNAISKYEKFVSHELEDSTPRSIKEFEMTVKEKLSKKASREAAVELDSTLALNDVLLRGRVSSMGVEKELPSGDKVVEFRIVIARSDELGFDTIDISAWSSKLRRSASSLKTEEWVEISGSIKRRFWRGATGLASRWQIDASEISRL